jgi:hypothetical protein
LTTFYSGRSVEFLPTLHCDEKTYNTQKTRKYINRYRSKLEFIIPSLEKVLGLDGSHLFLLCSVRPKYFGITIPSVRVAYIDPSRRSIDGLVRTLVHEGLHLKQIQDKRLVWNERKRTLQWEGKAVVNYNYKNMEGYRNLPWEKDVYDNEQRVIDELVGDLCLRDSEEA